MHQYSIDNNTRIKSTFWLVCASIVISVAICILGTRCFSTIDDVADNAKEWGDLIKIIERIGILPNIIGVPAFFYILSKIFDNMLWKTKIFIKIHKVPDLNGEWEGTLFSNYLNGDINMKLEIEQTWTHIRCIAHFEKSDSYSNVAAIYTDENEGVVLYFSYSNTSKDVNIGNPQYIGYNKLILRNNELNGIYCNNRPNSKKGQSHGNTGSIHLKKVIRNSK